LHTNAREGGEVGLGWSRTNKSSICLQGAESSGARRSSFRVRRRWGFASCMESRGLADERSASFAGTSATRPCLRSSRCRGPSSRAAFLRRGERALGRGVRLGVAGGVGARGMQSRARERSARTGIERCAISRLEFRRRRAAPIGLRRVSAFAARAGRRRPAYRDGEVLERRKGLRAR